MFKSETGSFTSPASTGNQVVNLDSSIWNGESGKAVIIQSTAMTADGFREDAILMIGMATSSTNRAAICGASDNGLQDTDTDRRVSHTHCISLLDAGGAVLEEADFVSFNSNSFTINWTTVSASAVVYTYKVIGGSDVTNVFIDHIVGETSVGLKSYTIGFQPDFLIGIGGGINSEATLPDTQSVYSNPMIGFSDGTTDICSMCSSDSGEATTDTWRAQLDDFLVFGEDGAVNERANVNAFLADGYRLYWSDTGATGKNYAILCVKGPNVTVGKFNSYSTSGTQAVSIGFTPVAGMFCTTMSATAATIQTYARLGIGSFDRYGNQSFLGIVDEGLQAVSDCDSVMRRDRSIATVDHAQTYTNTAIVTPDGTNLDVEWEVTDGTNREIGYIVFGDVTAPPAPSETKKVESGVIDVDCDQAQGFLQLVKLDPAIWENDAPKAVIFYGVGAVDTHEEGHTHFSFGAATGSDRASVAAGVAQHSSTVNTIRHHSKWNVGDNRNPVWLFIFSSGTLGADLHYMQSAPNHFLLRNRTNITSGTLKVGFIALGGSDVEAYIDHLTVPNTDGLEARTGIGFQPNSLIKYSCILQNTMDISYSHMVINIGLHAGGANGGTKSVSCVSWDSGSDTGRYATDTLFHSSIDDFYIGEVASLDEDGYTWDWTSVNNDAHNVWVLCLKGFEVELGAYLEPTVDSSVQRELAIEPLGGLILTPMSVETGISQSDELRIGVGAWDESGNQNFAGILEKDASTWACRRVQDSNEFIKHIDNNSPPNLVGSCSLSKNKNVITETWTNTGGSQLEHWVLWFGKNPITASCQKIIDAHAINTGDAMVCMAGNKGLASGNMMQELSQKAKSKPPVQRQFHLDHITQITTGKFDKPRRYRGDGD